MANMHFDKVLQQIGEKGPYQNFIFYLLCIPASITSAFLSFSQVFVSATPDHWCKIPFFINSTASPKLSPIEQRKIAIPYVDGKYAKCHMYSKYASNDGFSETDYISVVNFKPNSTWPIIKCPYGWNYDNTDYDMTLVTQFDLVCDKAWWPPFSTTLFFVGSLIGNVLFGWISDRWGRRTAFFLILIVDIVSTTAAAFSYNYEIYSILRLFSGMCFPALYQVSFILALELMGPHCRTMVGMVITTLFSLSMSFLAALGYLVRDWYKLSLATSVPFIFIFSYFWILPESPRWLLSKNRLDEAEKIVQKIAQTNNKNIPLNFLRKLEEESSSLTGQTNFRSESSDESVSVLEILKYPQTRLRFLIISFDWIAIAVVYNGLSYNVSNLGIGDHQAFFIGGLVEILSHFFTWYLMDLWGRRSVLFISMVVGGFACVCCMFVSEGSIWTTLTLAMIGKFGNAAAFGVFYVFVGELLPTVIRSQAMGFASFVGGIGLLGFPYIIRLGEYNRMYPLVVMGFLSLGGGLMIVLLPETLHVNLPQTLEDGEAMKVQSYSFYLPKNHTGRNHSKSKQKKDDSAIYNGTELEDLSHFTVNSVN